MSRDGYLLALRLLEQVDLVLHLSGGRLVLLAQVVGSFLGLHVHLFQQLPQLRQLRVALLVRLRLGGGEGVEEGRRWRRWGRSFLPDKLIVKLNVHKFLH